MITGKQSQVTGDLVFICRSKDLTFKNFTHLEMGLKKKLR